MDEATQEHGSGPATRERRPRRRRTIAQKVAIVCECLEPGASLAGVALAHRANANMVRKWVVKYQQGGYGQSFTPGTTLLPVVVKVRSDSRIPTKIADPKPAIEIELARGTLRFSGPIDRAVLRLVIDALSA